MLKVIKYRILTILEDKIVFVLLALAFIAINYTAIFASGLLRLGTGDYHGTVKYELLANSFAYGSFLSTIVLSIYLGMGLIGKDVQSNQIYLLLSVYSNRVKYIISNWISLALSIFTITCGFVLNLFSIGLVQNVSVNYSEILVMFTEILLNGIVVMTITSVFSILIKGNGSMLTGILSLVIYYLYAFEKILVTEVKVTIPHNVKQLLCNFAPISEPAARSLVELGLATKHLVLPYLINNLMLYQIIFCLIILAFGIAAFKYRDV